MATSIPEFWNLAAQGGLFSPQQLQQLQVAFGQVKGAAVQGNARTLAEWLISRNLLTRYQTNILLAGHPGPFIYGQYKISDLLDGPPFAGMFRATHIPTGHPVLLRFLTGDAVGDPRRWGSLSAQLRRHCAAVQPNLQRCFEVVDLDSFKFMAVEEVQGRSLQTALEGGKRLPPPEACRIVRSAALALDAMQRSQVAHGNVCPAKLLLEQTAHIKLIRDPLVDSAPIDFLQSDPEGQLLARADYLAPDFLQAGKSADGSTDIYALGCVFYQLLTGQPPFAGGDVRQKMQQHASQAIPPLETAGVPKAIADTATYMLAKSPASRFQQASQIAAQLTAQVEPSRLNITSPAPPPTLAAYEQACRASAAAATPAPAAPAPTPVASGSVTPAVAAATTPIATSAGTAAASEPATRRRRSRKNNNAMMVGFGIGGAALLIIIGLIIMGSMSGGPPPKRDDATANDSDDTEPGVADEVPIDDEGGTTGAETDFGSRFIPVADDGNTPWLPPTTGSPISLRYVAPGSQFFMVARPADLLATTEGPRVLEALGPTFVESRSAWESASGCSLADVEQMIISLHDGPSSFPLPAVVVKLKQAVPKDELVQRWGSPAPVSIGSNELYNGRGGWSYYIPSDGRDKVFVMAAEQQIRDIIEFNNAPPTMRLAINKLLRASDDSRHLTILFSPNELIVNLFRDGRQLSLCEPQKIREPLDWFLGDGIEAGMLSLHLDKSAFAELMMIGRLGRQKDALAKELQDRLQQMPDLVERYIVRLNPDPYWRRVALRYPQMIRYLHEQTRIGTEGEIAVVNAALPLPALHNLTFGGQMALASTPGVATAPVASTTDRPQPKSMTELLSQRLTLRFAQDSLEFSMQNIEAEVRDTFPNLDFPFAIRIIGADLEKNGITRNQQIRDFDQQNKTVAEILTAMVVKANPKASSGPKDPDQQLIWTVGPDPSAPSNNVVLITTRDAAAEKNYQIPTVLRLD